jgi:hypothetical protein
METTVEQEPTWPCSKKKQSPRLEQQFAVHENEVWSLPKLVIFARKMVGWPDRTYALV